MKNETLLKRVGELGFPLLKVEKGQNANLTLADMVKSRDLRFWEGFPVVLANSAEKGLFDFEQVNRYLKTSSDRTYFVSLVALSLALYRFFDLKFSWADGLYERLPEGKKNEVEGFVKKLKEDGELAFVDRTLSSRRLKSDFNNYFSQAQNQLSELLFAREGLGLEYALSQLFSPKQKELLLKKLKREKLNKTEKEYFSRVVNKKVVAVANSELQRLAQRLLE